MNTYWVNPTNRRSSSGTRSETTDESGIYYDKDEGGDRDETLERPSLMGDDVAKPVNQRLVDWMVELLLEDLKKIKQSRKLCGLHENENHWSYLPPAGATFLAEAKEIITMPAYNPTISQGMDGYKEIVVETQAIEELRAYVTSIASMYR